MKLDDILINERLKKDFDNRVNIIFRMYKLYNIMEHEEFYQEACIYVIKGIEDFDPNRAKLGTFLSTLIAHCGKRMIRNARGQSEGLNKLEFHRSMSSLDFVYSDDGEDNAYNFVMDTKQNIEEQVVNREIINNVLSNELTQFQKDILALRLKGMYQEDIAKILNTSQVSISRHLTKIKLKIMNSLEIVG